MKSMLLLIKGISLITYFWVFIPSRWYSRLLRWDFLWGLLVIWETPGMYLILLSFSWDGLVIYFLARILALLELLGFWGLWKLLIQCQGWVPWSPLSLIHFRLWLIFWYYFVSWYLCLELLVRKFLEELWGLDAWYRTVKGIWQCKWTSMVMNNFAKNKLIIVLFYIQIAIFHVKIMEILSQELITLII